ncbi:MAG: Rieske (2Fe-2S) protein [Acetobacteraceae bacterium]|nr:Rieske (2Fe-2S) protein [Acetobacteraceae bacterium]
MSKHVVAAVADIPPGTRKLVTVRGRSIVVFNIKGEFFGVFNRCPHQGGEFVNGTLCGLIQAKEPGVYTYTREGEVLRCPWHGWEFDVRTGQSWCEPTKIQARSYSVEITSGAALTGGELVPGPYAAETVPVAVEQDYIVVNV